MKKRESSQHNLGLVAPGLVRDGVIPHGDHRLPALQVRLTVAHPQAAHQLPQIVLRHKALYPALHHRQTRHGQSISPTDKIKEEKTVAEGATGV
jgi:hypothetical protein